MNSWSAEHQVFAVEQFFVDMLKNFFLSRTTKPSCQHSEKCFQQDGARVHTARASMEAVRRMFQGQVISRFGDVPWTLVSALAGSTDLLLVSGGHLKTKVHKNKPRTIQKPEWTTS